MQTLNIEISSKFHDVYIECLKVLKKCTKLHTFGSERVIELRVKIKIINNNILFLGVSGKRLQQDLH